MSGKESTISAVDLKSIIISFLVGIGIYFVSCFLWALMIRGGILSYNLIYIMPKLSLLAAALFACGYGARRGRGEPFLNSLSSAVLLFAFGILLALSFPDKDWDTAGAVICLLICCLSCLLMTLRKRKNSKLHKRRKKH